MKDFSPLLLGQQEHDRDRTVNEQVNGDSEEKRILNRCQEWLPYILHFQSPLPKLQMLWGDFSEFCAYKHKTAAINGNILQEMDTQVYV